MILFRSKNFNTNFFDFFDLDKSLKKKKFDDRKNFVRDCANVIKQTISFFDDNYDERRIKM